MTAVDRLLRQVLLTVAYSDQFAYPLRSEEIHQRLINTRASLQQVRRAVALLQRLGFLHSQDGFVSLASSDVARLLRARHESEERAKIKWREVRQFTDFVSRLPLVLGVAVTGSVALNQGMERGDVDFLIVTKQFSLWLVRPLVVFYAWLNGKRRSWSHEEGDSWCLNLWLEEDELRLSLARRTVYSAYEVCQALWVLEREGVARRFYLENSWVATYLPEFYHQRLKLTPAPSRTAAVSSNELVGEALLHLLSAVHMAANAVLWIGQYWYMRGHITQEEVSFHKAFFHPRDTRSMIGMRWRDRLKLFALSVRLRALRPVLATGVFDGLHAEHQQFLRNAREYARQQGAPLLVGIESDVRTRQLKGPGRPVHDQASRLAAIQKMGVADEVFVLPESFSSMHDHRGLLFALLPSALAVSSHSLHLEGKRALMAEIGGVVTVVHRHNPAVSTTLLVRNGVYDKQDARERE